MWAACDTISPVLSTLVIQEMAGRHDADTASYTLHYLLPPVIVSCGRQV